MAGGTKLKAGGDLPGLDSQGIPSRKPWGQNLAPVRLILTLYPFIQILESESQNRPSSSMWKLLFLNVCILKIQIVMLLSKCELYILYTWQNTGM